MQPSTSRRPSLRPSSHSTMRLNSPRHVCPSSRRAVRGRVCLGVPDTRAGAGRGWRRGCHRRHACRIRASRRTSAVTRSAGVECPKARNDVPWDRPDDFDQPTDTAAVEQLAFEEPAWDKPAAESWTDDVDAEDSPAPYAPSPNGRELDFDFPAWSGAGVATAVAAEVATAPVETEAVATELVEVDAVAEVEAQDEEMAAADPDDAYAPVLGDVPAATARAWPETNGHDVSRNGSTVTAEPFVLSAVAEPFVDPLAPEESNRPGPSPPSRVAIGKSRKQPRSRAGSSRQQPRPTTKCLRSRLLTGPPSR